MSRLASLIAALALIGIASTANAQVYADDNGDFGAFYVSSTTTTTTAVGAALIYATVATAISDKESVAMLRYLRENGAAVEQHVALGGGSTVDDLAELLDLPATDRRSLGLALRLASPTLRDLASPDRLDSDRASRFAKTVRLALSIVKLEASSSS